MRSITATLMIVGTFAALTVSCNDRAEMGHPPQRRSGGNNVIPAGFTNEVSADDFRARSKQLSQGDVARGLTLSPEFESALALNAVTEDSASEKDSWAAFPAACPTLSALTGSNLQAPAIRELSLQTSFALTAGVAGCSDLLTAAGIDAFRTLNAVRFLADKMASSRSLTQDCVSMQLKEPGKRYALAWDLSRNPTGAWLTANNVTEYNGEITGGAKDGQTALSAWTNLSGMSGETSQELISSVNVFVDDTEGHSAIENIEQYRSGAETVFRKTLINYDFITGRLSETTTYESRSGDSLISSREISAVISRTDEGLTLTLGDEPGQTGADATVKLSLDGGNTLRCSVQ